MNKELCFNIENKNLYLEQVLVDYMDVPIFFLCKGENQYYIVLCVDIEELRYIVTKLSLNDVYNLLHGKTPMRDIILKQKQYWDIISGDEIYLDNVIKKSICELNESWLPKKDAYFKILTEQMKLFVDKFDNENEFFDYEYILRSSTQEYWRQLFVSSKWNILLKNIKQITKLQECHVKKNIYSEIPLYYEGIKSITTKEIKFRNQQQSNQREVNDSFELSELLINNIVVAS